MNGFFFMSPCRNAVLTVVLAATLLSPDLADAQEVERSRAYGLTAQLYPAGVIVAGRASFPIFDKSTLNAHVGYNATDRRDFGEHDNEEGGGLGIGLGLRRYFGDRYTGFHYGLRTDLWFLEIDWRDDTPPASGTTDVLVLQPTAQLGYDHAIADGRVVLEGTVALGLEINVDTDGEPVGEGAIFLVGLGVAFR